MKYTRVKSAKLHNTYHSVGIGQLDKTLDAGNYSGMELAFNGDILQVKYKGCKIGIPAASVAGVTYFDSEVYEWEPAPVKPVTKAP